MPESPNGYIRQAHRNMVSSGEAALVERARELLLKWAGEWVPYERGAWCLRKLLNRRHRCTSVKCYFDEDDSGMGMLMALDHMEMWKTLDSRFVVTAHPYPGWSGRMELWSWCNTHGLFPEVYPTEQSWYWPGGTELIVIPGK